jgi:hypothetical protein
MSWPRSAILAIVEPTGMAPGDGSGPGRRLASLSQSAFGAAGAAVTFVAPAGSGSTGATDTDAGAAEDPQPATPNAMANSANTIRVLTGTP